MSDQNEPKLIIDEDWKTQVQREKEELNRKKAEQEAAAANTEPPAQASEVGVGQTSDSAKADAKTQELPPASIAMLIYSLGAQAMAAMGALPLEEGEAPEVNFDLARHFIDLLGVLEEKTKGNLTADENRYLQDTLYQLRLAFVEMKSRR